MWGILFFMIGKLVQINGMLSARRYFLNKREEGLFLQSSAGKGGSITFAPKSTRDNGQNNRTFKY